MDRVIIATVTYNSSHFLRRLVEHAAKQTHKVDKIVAVDNASYEEHVLKNKELMEEYPFLEIVRMEDNLGGAGGFEQGIRYIFAQNYEFDWIWIMDDDAFPREDCLEKLLEYKGLPEVGALTPMIFGVELGKYQIYHHKKESRYLDKDIWIANSIDDLQDVTKIETNAFVGPLVKKEVFDNVGYPDGGLFIYGDDTEFMYRVSRKYSVYLIKNAVINHRDVIEKPGVVNPKAFWKEYYKYRNRFLFVQKYQTTCLKGVKGRALVMIAVLKETGSTIKNKKFKGVRKLRIALLQKSVIDGMRGINGKTIDPATYVEQFNILK